MRVIVKEAEKKIGSMIAVPINFVQAMVRLDQLKIPMDLHGFNVIAVGRLYKEPIYSVKFSWLQSYEPTKQR